MGTARILNFGAITLRRRNEFLRQPTPRQTRNTAPPLTHHTEMGIFHGSSLLPSSLPADFCLFHKVKIKVKVNTHHRDAEARRADNGTFIEYNPKSRRPAYREARVRSHQARFVAFYERLIFDWFLVHLRVSGPLW